jgi:hypothetical protein
MIKNVLFLMIKLLAVANNISDSGKLFVVGNNDDGFN